MTLKEALEPWLAIDTWHTEHSLDRERFHRAVESAFRSRREFIHVDEFRDAIREVLEECDHEKDIDSDHWLAAIHKYAQRAEDIGAFLYDTGLLNQLRLVDGAADDD